MQGKNRYVIFSVSHETGFISHEMKPVPYGMKPVSCEIIYISYVIFLSHISDNQVSSLHNTGSLCQLREAVIAMYEATVNRVTV
jgi:hypothetical protein